MQEICQVGAAKDILLLRACAGSDRTTRRSWRRHQDGDWIRSRQSHGFLQNISFQHLDLGPLPSGKLLDWNGNSIALLDAVDLGPGQTKTNFPHRSHLKDSVKKESFFHFGISFLTWGFWWAAGFFKCPYPLTVALILLRGTFNRSNTFHKFFCFCEVLEKKDTALWIFNFGFGELWFDAMKDTKGFVMHWPEDSLQEAVGVKDLRLYHLMMLIGFWLGLCAHCMKKGGQPHNLDWAVASSHHLSRKVGQSQGVEDFLAFEEDRCWKVHHLGDKLGGKKTDDVEKHLARDRSNYVEFSNTAMKHAFKLFWQAACWSFVVTM